MCMQYSFTVPCNKSAYKDNVTVPLWYACKDGKKTKGCGNKDMGQRLCNFPDHLIGHCLHNRNAKWDSALLAIANEQAEKDEREEIKNQEMMQGIKEERGQVKPAGKGKPAAKAGPFKPPGSGSGASSTERRSG